jgi:hypothetical protein
MDFAVNNLLGWGVNGWHTGFGKVEGKMKTTEMTKQVIEPTTENG